MQEEQQSRADYAVLMTVVRSLFSLSALRACDSFLQSSRPLHMCDSSMRCLSQKWPLQKVQSPMMRWAAVLHSLKLQRGLRTGMVDVLCVLLVGQRSEDGEED
jgi:hypothetical protein